MFINNPTIAFRRNENRQDCIGGHLIKDGKKKLEKRQGKSKTCNATRSPICCMQMINTNTFKSNKKKRFFNIYQTITCKNKWIIYSLECMLYNLQYIGKSETSIHIRLNNHRKEVSNPKAIPACIHFRKEGHSFIQYTKFALIEQLTETENISKANLKLRLK